MTNIKLANLTGYNRTETIDRWERSESEGLNRRRMFLGMGGRLYERGITSMEELDALLESKTTIKDEYTAQLEDALLEIHGSLKPLIRKVKK